MSIILLSKPAAGKGTLAKSLVDHLDLLHISSGDLLRTEISKQTDLGISIESDMKKGILISDDIVLNLLEEKLKTTNKNIVLDGIPRNINQAKKLDNILISDKITHVILLNVSDDEIKRRILGRRICPNCSRTYNIYTSDLMPKVENVCDACDTTLITREDDNEESLNKRLDQFNKETKPLIDYYKDKNLLYEVNSSKSHKGTFVDVLKILEESTNDSN